MSVQQKDNSISLAELVKFLMATLVKWARTRQFGEIRIVVQDGKIQGVHESCSYREGLPNRDTAEQAALKAV